MRQRCRRGADPAGQILTFRHQLGQQTAPLVAKDVGPGEAAVSAAHAQVGDALLYQVEGSSEPAIAGGEGLAPGRTDHGPTLGGVSGQRWC